MTAVTPTSQRAFHKRPAVRRVCIAFALVIAVSGALFALVNSVVSQDSTGTAVASPTVEELESLRDRVIDDEVDQLELEFVEYNDSGVEGTVTLYDLDDQTLVAILIEEGGEVHPAHIHTGTCNELDPLPFAPLSNVENNEPSLSVVDTPLPELIDGDYAVDLHLSPNELGTLIVCADIEGTPVPATPAPAPATPAATAVGGSIDITGEATETPEPTLGPAAQTPEPTQAPATETPQPTVTPEPTNTPVPTSTPEPTDVPATEAPTQTPVPTDGGLTQDDSADDGTGGASVAGGIAAPPTSGKGGVIASADGTSGAGGAVSGKGDAITITDGTSGVGGDGDDRAATTLPQRAGVGSSILSPESTTQAIAWSLGTFALILAAFGVMMRRAERNDRRPPRWSRLGI